jgi:hypothetical protein
MFHLNCYIFGRVPLMGNQSIINSCFTRENRKRGYILSLERDSNPPSKTGRALNRMTIGTSHSAVILRFANFLYSLFSLNGRFHSLFLHLVEADKNIP